MNTHFRRASRALALAAALLLMTGCSPAAQPAAETPASDAVTIDDAWVKSAPDGMTAAFGILTNSGDDDVTISSAQTDAAERIELHETVADASSGGTTMREVDGGFVIPAGGTLALEPGGSHLMLMGVTDAIEAGEEVSFTLTFADGSTLTFPAAAKDFTGAQEHYESDHDDHDEHGDPDSDQEH